jgi:hypothetical protein
MGHTDDHTQLAEGGRFSGAWVVFSGLSKTGCSPAFLCLPAILPPYFPSHYLIARPVFRWRVSCENPAHPIGSTGARLALLNRNHACKPKNPV